MHRPVATAQRPILDESGGYGDLGVIPDRRDESANASSATWRVAEGEQFLRVGDAEVGVGQAGEHPGQLAGPFDVPHHAHTADRHRTGRVLVHHEMVVGERGDLRQVGHAST